MIAPVIAVILLIPDLGASPANYSDSDTVADSPVDVDGADTPCQLGVSGSASLRPGVYYTVAVVVEFLVDGIAPVDDFEPVDDIPRVYDLTA